MREDRHAEHADPEGPCGREHQERGAPRSPVPAHPLCGVRPAGHIRGGERPLLLPAVPQPGSAAQAAGEEDPDELVEVECYYCRLWPNQVPCCGVCHGSGRLKKKRRLLMTQDELVRALDAKVARLQSQLAAPRVRRFQRHE
jgi:hypothetical protein